MNLAHIGNNWNILSQTEHRMKLNLGMIMEKLNEPKQHRSDTNTLTNYLNNVPFCLLNGDQRVDNTNISMKIVYQCSGLYIYILHHLSQAHIAPSQITKYPMAFAYTSLLAQGQQ